MTQDERWQSRYDEVKSFIEVNKRNPSKHRVEEHDYLNWLKANKEGIECRKPEIRAGGEVQRTTRTL